MYANYQLLVLSQVYFYTFFTTLNVKASKINCRKKCVTFRGMGGGLVDKIDMWRFPNLARFGIIPCFNRLIIIYGEL